MQLADVVPWGRNLNEYQSMFELSHEDLTKHILGCGDGPSSFNSECTRNEGHVISIDPIYQFDHQELENRIAETAPLVLHQVQLHVDDFIWDQIHNPDELLSCRMAAMQQFLNDYELGRQQGRYVTAQLPKLPFHDQQFDLALCSHLLFLYSKVLTQDFHIQSIHELCRVAQEVRIYPLVDLQNQRSQHLDAVIQSLKTANLSTQLVPVRYQFQRGATEMLVIKRRPQRD